MVYLPKWKNVRVRQELVGEVKKEVERSTKYQSISNFVSDSIRLRLQALDNARARTLQLQEQLLYTPKHIWAKLTLRGNIQLGVSNYFQSQHEGIVHVDTFNVGEHISKNKSFGNVETVGWWWIHVLYSPIDGEIVKVNKKVIDDPCILNEDPYQWIVEIRPDDPEFGSWMNQLLSFKEYKKLTIKLEWRPHSPITDLELNEIIEDIKRGA